MDSILAPDKSRDVGGTVLLYFPPRTFLAHESVLTPRSRPCRHLQLIGPWYLYRDDTSHGYATHLQ
jgi:hypothetical protein